MVSSTFSAACGFPIKLLQHAGYRVDVIPVEGVVGISALYHLYHIYVFLVMWIPIFDHRPDQTFICHFLHVTILDLETTSEKSQIPK